MLALLSKMFSLAERWGVRPDHSNPCRHVQKFRERKRTRFLSGEELARLGAELAASESRGLTLPVAAFRLLVLTGCRRGEILGLRWSEVDLERGCLQLTDSKTGPKVVPLGAAAVALLASLARDDANPYVLPGEKPGTHLTDIGKAWQRLRRRAGLRDVASP